MGVVGSTVTAASMGGNGADAMMVGVYSDAIYVPFSTSTAVALYITTEL
jgi:hypothetical protein